MKNPREIADGLTGNEREKFILSIQTPVTKSLYETGLKRTEEEQKLYVYNKRYSRIDEKAQCKKEDGSIDLNVREISAEEYKLHQEHRKTVGPKIEATRTAYLNSKKLDDRLKDKIETAHVLPTPELKEKAVRAFVRGSPLQYVRDKFKEIMDGLFKPSHAEIVAEEMRRMNGK